MKRRVTQWLQLLVVVVLEAVLVVVLYATAPYLGSVSLSHFGTWVRTTSPADAILPILRLGGLVVSSWLLATTLVYVALASAPGGGPIRRARTGWLPPRLIRHLVDGVVAASIVVSSVGASATLASATTTMPAVTATVPRRPSPSARAPAVARSDHETHRRPVRVPTRSTPSRPGGTLDQVAVDSRPIGRHLPHPGAVHHRPPNLLSAPDPEAPSAADGFVGLAPGTKVVVVQPGDCLSVLAQRHLGNWQRDHEITALNLGRIQPDGNALRDEHWIYPGWVLVMPANATATEVVSAPPAPRAAPLPAPASSTASGGVATPTTTWAPITEPAAGASSVGGAGAAASSVTSGPIIVPAAGASSSAVAGAAAPSATTAPVGAPPTMVAMAAAQSERPGRYAPKLVEAGLAGAALLSTVELLRRRQARRRAPGHRIPLPDPALTKAELALRRSSAPDREALVDQALGDLVAALRQREQTPPPILGVLVDGESVDVLLAEPAVPPPRWHASVDGFGWRIAALELEGSEVLESSPLPALVAVGRVASGKADVVINLEAAGMVTISGDPVTAVGLLWSMATHLAGVSRGRAVNLVLIGFPAEMAQTDNCRVAASLAEVAEELRSTSEVMAAAARDSDCGDLFTARLRQVAGDGWPPVVVLSAVPLDSEQVRFLTSVARPGGGVAAVVVNAEGGAGWNLDITAHPCPVHPLRLAIEPTVMDAEAVTVVSNLLRIAGDTRGAERTDPPYDQIELSADDRESDASPDDPAPHVVVRVLGTVEVDGAAEFKRAKSRELVVYLAMHPHGVGEAELDEALWGTIGTRVVAPSTRDSTVSVARTALGGPGRLLPAQGQGREKRYQLGSEVTSDWRQFCTLHRLGRERRSTTVLRQALELVRGRPFQAVVSGRTYGWIHTEGLCRHIEAEIADAADLAAGLFLEQGDPGSARWAARQGLLADPYTERLWVRLMEAADALGESQEIERIMDEMDIVLELEGDFSGLHPNTLAAYDRLSRRRQRRASA